MQLKNQEVVNFLRGANSVRDGNLISLSILKGEIEWDPFVQIVFNVPQGESGNLYTLRLSGNVKCEYNFSSDYSFEQIAFVKCLWTASGHFYLSLDPWREDEDFVNDQDNDCFESQSVHLTVDRSAGPLWSR